MKNNSLSHFSMLVIIQSCLSSVMSSLLSVLYNWKLSISSIERNRVANYNSTIPLKIEAL